jgi:hypothetical protein
MIHFILITLQNSELFKTSKFVTLVPLRGRLIQIIDSL